MKISPRRATPTSAGDWDRLNRATAGLEPPFALIDLQALEANADDLVRRADGKGIRLASKSVRCRELQQRTLGRAGFGGTLAFTLPEALWLASCGFGDLVVAYPTTDRDALRALTRRDEEGVTIMVDGVEHLDYVDAAVGARSRPIRVCIDVNAGLRLVEGRISIGAKRSPIHTPEQASALAAEIQGRPGFQLVGLMAYEAQIAGVGDLIPRRPARSLAIQVMQRASARELRERRAKIVEAVRAVASLEFVNGGGTGSLGSTAADGAVTEVAAGSGLFGPTLFDSYRSFRPAPAAMFALSVVRKPRADAATVLGGGYLASGPGDAARLPRPFLPAGLRLDRREGAGEVQTPLLGRAASDLRVGDRVYFRHAKAGEMCERFDRLYVVEDDRVVDEVPTYRGEGKCFL
ncbi:MAG: amino acid deaminase/aldolase [Actinomycetota bacterium]